MSNTLPIADKVINLIGELPDKPREALIWAYDEVIGWKGKIAKAPEFIRAMIANMLGHNIVKVLKDHQIDSPMARYMTLEFLKWAFNLDDGWLPKWSPVEE